MKSFLKRSIATLAILAIGAGAASAADLKGVPSADDLVTVAPEGKPINWNTIYAGIQGHYDWDNHDLTASSTGGPVFAELNGFGGHGLGYGAIVGGDLARGNFLFGAACEYDDSDSEAKFNIGGHGGLTATASRGTGWDCFGRFGYLWGTGKRALLYGFAGYGQQDQTYAISAGLDRAAVDKSTNGFVYGIGAEYAFNNFASIDFRLKRFDGDSITVYSDQCITLRDNPDYTTAVFGLKIKVGPGALGY